jgi:Arm DNA-binding domain
MRHSSRSQREAISETVIAAASAEVSKTGRIQIVVDAHCTALRLVVTPSGAPRWLLFCYNEQGTLEKRSIGHYPRIGIEEAREQAWKLRLKVKGFAGKATHPSEITLEKLVLLYETHCAKSVHWGDLKNDIIYALKPFVFCSLKAINTKKLKKYIDGYSSPGNMKKVLIKTRAIIAWGEESGAIKLNHPSLTNCIAAGIKDAERTLRRLK